MSIDKFGFGESVNIFKKTLNVKIDLKSYVINMIFSLISKLRFYNKCIDLVLYSQIIY